MFLLISSRGIGPKELVSSTLWWQGPAWDQPNRNDWRRKNTRAEEIRPPVKDMTIRFSGYRRMLRVLQTTYPRHLESGLSPATTEVPAVEASKTLREDRRCGSFERHRTLSSIMALGHCRRCPPRSRWTSQSCDSERSLQKSSQPPGASPR